ncbi:MAG: LacI family DNA-binding transcriptional regulator [Nitriliruptoraceae bacterium]
MKPRLKHVADHAGVSQATVSRVLNDRPGVADATRRSVLQAMAQLGYEHGRLRTSQRTGLVGLIVPELDNPVFPRFAQAVESRLAREGFTTVLCTSTPSGMGEADYLDVLQAHAVTGMVLISGEHSDTSADHQRYHALRASGMPLVLVNGRDEDLGDIAAVTVDHAEVTRLAVAHLVSLGHTRIGLALGPGRYVTAARLQLGYLDGLERAGVPVDATLITDTIYGIEGGHAAGAVLLPLGVTAVVCASDRMALGVVRAVTERGLKVPGDVSVIGFDDAGPNAFFDPPLTSVQQPFEAMSSAVVQLLTAQISDAEAAAPELTFRPELVVRASTGAAPGLPADGGRDAERRGAATTG